MHLALALIRDWSPHRMPCDGKGRIMAFYDHVPFRRVRIVEYLQVGLEVFEVVF